MVRNVLVFSNGILGGSPEAGVVDWDQLAGFDKKDMFFEQGTSVIEIAKKIKKHKLVERLKHYDEGDKPILIMSLEGGIYERMMRGSAVYDEELVDMGAAIIKVINAVQGGVDNIAFVMPTDPSCGKDPTKEFKINILNATIMTALTNSGVHGVHMCETGAFMNTGCYDKDGIYPNDRGQSILSTQMIYLASGASRETNVPTKAKVIQFKPLLEQRG